MAQADCESKPDVGSSRKSNNDGLATNSTPIDNFFRCSTFNPLPNLPTTASAYPRMSKTSMIFSTYSNFSASLTSLDLLNLAANCNDSLTVTSEK